MKKNPIPKIKETKANKNEINASIFKSTGKKKNRTEAIMRTVPAAKP